MTPGIRCFGIWYCNRCMCQREFVSYDNENSDPDFAECYTCGYQYGKIIDETATDPSQRVRPRLDRAIVEAGRAKYVDQQRRMMQNLGLPEGGLPDDIRREYKRRRGMLD